MNSLWWCTCRFETSSGAVLTVTEDSVLDEGGGEAEGYEPNGDLGFPNNQCGVSILSVALADLGEMFFFFFSTTDGGILK